MASPTPNQHSWRGLAVSYGLTHLVVDLATVTAVFRATRVLGAEFWTPVSLVIGYDLMAFALQWPLGMLADRFRATRPALLVGLLLTACSLGLIPFSAVGTMVAAGLGNALFHLGAGARVLVIARGRSAPAGVFVAPGALGLGLGIWFGRHGNGAVWPLALLLLCAALVVWRLRESPEPAIGRLDLAPAAVGRKPASLWLVVIALLLVSVMIRSLVGFAGSYQAPKTALLAWGLPLAGFAGKLLGGFVSDRLGWLETTVGALLISAPMIAWSGGNPYVVLPAMMIFQATMPVTLTAVYLVFSRHPATAFGLPCFALVAGALPTFHPATRQYYGSTTFLVLIVVSALSVASALVLLGIPHRWRFGKGASETVRAAA